MYLPGVEILTRKLPHDVNHSQTKYVKAYLNELVPIRSKKSSRKVCIRGTTGNIPTLIDWLSRQHPDEVQTVCLYLVLFYKTIS